MSAEPGEGGNRRIKAGWGLAPPPPKGKKGLEEDPNRAHLRPGGPVGFPVFFDFPIHPEKMQEAETYLPRGAQSEYRRTRSTVGTVVHNAQEMTHKTIRNGSYQKWRQSKGEPKFFAQSSASQQITNSNMGRPNRDEWNTDVDWPPVIAPRWSKLRAKAKLSYDINDNSDFPPL